jgi:DNA transformation protein and related proteins
MPKESAEHRSGSLRTRRRDDASIVIRTTPAPRSSEASTAGRSARTSGRTVPTRRTISMIRKGTSEFVDYLSEVFRTFGVIESRRMFGGYGIYHQGLIFGLVVDDALYLKTDELSASLFRSVGSTPFEFEKEGKLTQTSYYSMPAEAFDDETAASKWASLAFESARRARNGKKVKPKK